MHAHIHDRSVVEELARTLAARTLGPPPTEHGAAVTAAAGATASIYVYIYIYICILSGYPCIDTEHHAAVTAAAGATASHKAGCTNEFVKEFAVPPTAVSASDVKRDLFLRERVPDAALGRGGLPGASAFKTDATDVTDAASAKARILQAIADRARV